MRRKCHTCGGRDKCPLRKESDILTTASFDEPLSHCECCKGQAKQMQPCAKCNTLWYVAFFTSLLTSWTMKEV